MNTPTYAQRIEKKIREHLQPVDFELTDDSNAHAGHSGAHPSGETHFTLKVRSAAFNGLSRLDRQRLVYGLLADEMRERVHALALDLTPAAD